MSKPAADEPSDPRVEMQRQAQEMAQALMETAELPAKLGWEEFDFKVDPFDPLLDDLEGFIASGKRDNETLTAIFQVGMPRHVTLEARHGVLAELASRMASDVRLDVRQEARLVLRALQQLHVPPTSIGALWALYPRHLMTALRERHALFQREQALLTAEDHALVDALVAGKGDADSVKKRGEAGVAVLDRVFRTWTQKPPPSAPLAASLCGLAAAWPGMRMARGLSLALWHLQEPSVLAAARAAMGAMKEAARTVLEGDLMLHDPPPAVRREFYPALVAVDSPSVLPRMIEDLAGAGPWSEPGKGASHARPILDQVVKKGDRRAIPMMLLVMSVRPPTADVRSAIVAAFAASPMKDEFERGLKALEAGKPVVVSGGTTQEEFVGRYGQFTDRMKPEQFQAELARVSRLWEDCYHESAGWRIPREAAKDVGPREAELRTALEREVRSRMGRLAGRSPAAALENEFRTQWLITPHNDVSGRIPLAIILDERASRVDADEMREERLQQAAELYGLALRAAEGGVLDEAERCLKAALQVCPGHAFAKDALERLQRKEPLPGVGDAGEPPPQEKPRIIIP